MTSIPQLLNPIHQGHTVPGSARYPADAAISISSGSMDNQADGEGAPIQDPFTYYRAFLQGQGNEKSISASTGTNYKHSAKKPALGDPTSTLIRHHFPHGDTSTQAGDMFAAQNTQDVGEQQHCTPRAIPYRFSVHSAARVEGVRLATIVEQGSVSTLDSHGSLPRVGRFSPLQATENVSPGSPWQRVSRSLDEEAVEDTGEEKRQKQSPAATVKRYDRHSDPTSLHEEAVSVARIANEVQFTELPLLDFLDPTPVVDDGEGLFLGFPNHVRGDSRTSPHPTSSHTKEPWPNPDRLSPQAAHGESRREDRQGGRGRPIAPATEKDLDLGFDAPSHSPPNTKTKKRVSLSTHTDPPAGAYPPILQFSSAVSKVSVEIPSIPHSQSRTQSHHRDENELSSVCSVSSEECDAAKSHDVARATSRPARSEKDLAGTNASSELSICRNDRTSLNEGLWDTNLNASFCSTMSTSYSGPVLGIDLDLQQNGLHDTQHTTTPAWPGAGDNVAAQQNKSCRRGHHGEWERHPSRLITSSAISSLLPIATAEGIVRPNLTAPRLSFFSPSGNLIQTEDCPSQLPNGLNSSLDPDYPGNPTVTTYYNNDHAISAQTSLVASAGLPPVRPAVVPLTTPPLSIALLPEHLRHHHNYQQVERSCITNGTELDLTPGSTIEPGPNVKGCGGVIRADSLVPHSGVPRPSAKKFRDKRAILCFSNREVTRSRLDNLTYQTSPQKPKMLGNALPHMSNMSKPRSKGSIGPMAGHALRICFCQPYDGVGRRSVGLPCRDIADQCQDEPCVHEAREAETPNVRIIDTSGVGGKKRPKGKCRVSSDSGISIQTALRVGLVGV